MLTNGVDDTAIPISSRVAASAFPFDEAADYVIVVFGVRFQ